MNNAFKFRSFLKYLYILACISTETLIAETLGKSRILKPAGVVLEDSNSVEEISLIEANHSGIKELDEGHKEVKHKVKVEPGKSANLSPSGLAAKSSVKKIVTLKSPEKQIPVSQPTKSGMSTFSPANKANSGSVGAIAPKLSQNKNRIGASPKSLPKISRNGISALPLIQSNQKFASTMITKNMINEKSVVKKIGSSLAKAELKDVSKSTPKNSSKEDAKAKGEEKHSGSIDAGRAQDSVDSLIDREQEFQYSGASKDDPFLPPLGPITGSNSNDGFTKTSSTSDAVQTIDSEEIPIISPLQYFDVRQLFATGVWVSEDMRWKALIETPDQQGIVVKVNDPIGNSGGRVTAIDPGGVHVRQYKLRKDGSQDFSDVVIGMARDDISVPKGGVILLKPGAVAPEIRKSHDYSEMNTDRSVDSEKLRPQSEVLKSSESQKANVGNEKREGMDPALTPVNVDAGKGDSK
ncbi:MAG: pilus assembly protein PilP [Proteobacteria bacterium]|nr:pilus assembly protein PilP [Pseudomonadota bacterium]